MMNGCEKCKRGVADRLIHRLLWRVSRSGEMEDNR